MGLSYPNLQEVKKTRPCQKSKKDGKRNTEYAKTDMKLQLPFSMNEHPFAVQLPGSAPYLT